jgi:pilus assembly protein Flp/PilA
MLKLAKRFRKDDAGAALVEYGLLVGLIAAVCIGVVTITGTDVQAVFTAINAALATIPGV